MNNLEQQQDKEDEIVENIQETSFVPRFLRKLFFSDKKIGELNGKWAAMFKLTMIGMMCLIPTLFTWMVWVTTNVYDTKHHIDLNRDTISRIEQLEKADIVTSQLLRKIDLLNEKIDSLPPEDWRRRIMSLEEGFKSLPPDDWKRRVTTLETDSDQTQKLIVALDKANSTDHVKIEAILATHIEILQEIKNSVKK